MRETKCGLEAWRQLHQRYDPTTPQRDVDELRDIMHVTRSKSKSAIMGDIQIWETKIHRNAIRKGCGLDLVIPEGPRKSIIMSILSKAMETDIKGHMETAWLRSPPEAHRAGYLSNTTGAGPMISHTEETKSESWAAGDEALDEVRTETLNARTKLLEGKGKGRDRDKGKGKGKDKVRWRCDKNGHTQACASSD